MDETSEPTSTTTGPTATATAPEPEPAPASPSTYRRLVRRPERGMIAGVAAGLGEHFNIDPLVFRVIFGVSVLAGGLGIVAYGLLWWLVPTADQTVAEHERLRTWFRGLPTWVAVGLLIVGAAAISQGFGIWHPAIFWGVVLIGLGVLLFAHNPPAAERRRPPRAIDDSPERSVAYARTQPLPPPGFATVSDAPRYRRERSALGWITIGSVMLAIGVAALLDASGAVQMTAVRYLALALTILGVGMAVGARWGRARWLAVPAILLLPLVLAASFIDVPLQGGFGGRYFRPGTTAEIASTYRLTAGQLVLDLRDVRVGSSSREITATVAAGDLRVLVPSNIRLVVDASSGAGVVDLLHRTYDGVRVHVDRTFSPKGSVGQLVLHLHTGLGRVGLYDDRQEVSI